MEHAGPLYLFDAIAKLAHTELLIHLQAVALFEIFWGRPNSHQPTGQMPSNAYSFFVRATPQTSRRRSSPLARQSAKQHPAWRANQILYSFRETVGWLAANTWLQVPLQGLFVEKPADKHCRISKVCRSF